MHSSQYRRVREIRPNVFLGVSPQAQDDPVLLELVPWSADPAEAWQALRQSDVCERHDEGVICVTALVPPTGESAPLGHVQTSAQAVPSDVVAPPRGERHAIERDYFGAEQGVLRDVASALRASGSTGMHHSSEPTGIRGWIGQRRRLAVFAGGAGLVIAIALVVGLPRDSTATVTVPIASPSASSLEGSQLVPTETALTEDDPTQALEIMLASVSPEPMVAELTDALGVDGVRNIAMIERTRSGDMALVEVMGYTPDGKVTRASVSMQRDATGWRLRDVQSA